MESSGKNIIAQKNGRAYINDVAKISIGALLSLILILIVLIFRNSSAFTSSGGKYSVLDFVLLFLFLTVGLTVTE